MYKLTLHQNHILENLILFTKTLFISMLWAPWGAFVLIVILALCWGFRKSLKTTDAYKNSFSDNVYQFDFKQIGNWIGDVIDAINTPAQEHVIAEVASKVVALCNQFPIYK